MMPKAIINKEQIADIFPMSDISFGMVYHSLQHPGDAVYHDQIVFNIQLPAFDPTVFYNALLLVADRHENLRSNYNIFDYDSPVQIVFKHIVADFEHQDICSLSEKDQEDFISKCMHDDQLQPFVLASHTALWRVRTFLLDENNLMVIWINHHAVIDGWSTSLVMKDLHEAYTALKSHGRFSFEKLRSSYRDFVKAELTLKRSERVKQFWAEELMDLQRLRLPGNYREGDQLKNYFRTYNKDIYARIRGAAKQYGSSVKNICFTAYVYTIYMITHQTDLLLGLISHNRPVLEDGDKIVGCFLNTVPFRVNWPQHITWKQLLKLVDEKLLKVRQYEGLSLKEIGNLPGMSDSKAIPLVNTFFNYIDFYIYKEIREASVVDTTAPRAVHVGSYEKTNTYLDFMLDAGSEKLNLVIRYYESVVPGKLITAMSQYFYEVLHRITGTPDEICTKDSILSAVERQQLLQDFKGPESTYPDDKTIMDLFREQAVKSPRQLAVVSEDISCSYEMLDRKSDQVAAKILAEGVKPGSVVVVMMERSLELIIGLFAIMKAGAVYLPIDPGYPPERIRYLLEDSAAEMVLTNTETGNAWSSIRCRKMNLSHPDCYSGESGSFKQEVSPVAAAYMIYTSGSTGRPKGVIVNHQTLVNRIYWMQEAYALSPEDRILHKTPVSFDVSMWELCWWAISGASLVLLPPGAERNPMLISKVIAEQKVSVMHFVPSMLDVFLDFIGENSQYRHFPTLRIVFSSGEALKKATVSEFFRLFADCQLVNLYGPTEATVDVTYFNCRRQWDEEIIPIGKPINNISLYVLSKNRELQPEGVAGDLYICGGLALGYLNRPDLTHAAFVNVRIGEEKRLYKTGDIARWLENGELEFIGREDDQLKIRGVRIEPGEIEKVLRQYPDVEDVIVIGSKQQGDNTKLNAFIVCSQTFSFSQVTAFMAERIPSYMIPTSFYQLEAFPMKANGKIDRAELFRQAKRISSEEVFSLPVNEEERLIAEIWKQVLGIESVGINDNFFQIGGDSITILKVFNRLNKAFPKQLAVVDLFKYTTISSLATYYITGTNDFPGPNGEEEVFDILLNATKNLEVND
ncbi:non-ribosomal peptide synthetase [Chitinophaga sp. Ak27]|uniref:non-ribosomal peptide synthetase n=1 Tax=Chitinophaga sp. Ak27 TaxID=2726116 RepID=UPI00145F3711|nr:amino acid adenylation domain-containing protein [Chitinophaga sp. Ak27]NLU93278.1 amino acid adenylation domain-containing protein [Chitinophaga sp. Ak27]